MTVSPLITELQQWSHANGLVMYPEGFQGDESVVVHTPVTSHPTSLPTKCFQAALGIQNVFNELYARISCDSEWLERVSKELANHDPNFTGKLWNVYVKAKNQGIVQPLSLGLFRSDYMINTDEEGTASIKQVEFNTISVSFGGLSSKVADLHRFLFQKGYYNETNYTIESLPQSTACDDLASGLAAAHLEYTERHVRSSGHAVVVLFVVQPNERNVFDQKHVELSLLNNHGIKSRRVVFDDVLAQTEVTQGDRKLILKDTQEEVSIVYFRSGYSPDEYTSDSHWDTRFVLETCLAIKCPTIATQLAGTKKVQQLLCSRSVLERFVNEPEKISQLLETFVNIYPLDGEDRDEVVDKALNSPEQFVMKPQREGGGNNIYKEDIVKFIQGMNESEEYSILGGYILMELIHTSTQKNTIVRSGKAYPADIVSELGVFGTVLWDEGKVLKNTTAGWLLRSKFNSSNEGGVAAGFGCVDSVLLT